MLKYLPDIDIGTAIQDIKNSETSHLNKLAVEYKQSSENPKDAALILTDQGTWIESKSYLNEDLNTDSFFDVRPYLSN